MANWWINYPWRVIQPNFREIDTRDFDEERFLGNLKDFACNTVMLNAAGLIANYPTELSDHTRNAYLDGFDLKHLVERCHENDIRVIARTDFSKIPLAVYNRHPDWAYRKPDGEPLIYNGYVQTCLSGGYQGEYMDEILEEMFTKIPFDGIYCNMGTATGVIVDYSMNRYGPCQCEACRKAFKGKYGMEIPAELTRSDKASMIYFRFMQELAGAQKKRVMELLRRINPGLAYCSVDYVRQEANTEYGRELPHWQYQASSNARAIRGMGSEANVADVDFMGFSYRHTSVNPALQELRLWQTLANFGGLDYYIMGRPDSKEDRSAFPRVQKIFRYAEEHEDVCYGIASVAEVLLVREAYILPNAEERGWIRALTESHILFDETLTSGLAKLDLEKYKTVILPEKPRLSPVVQEKLNVWVKDGGILLASGQLPVMDCFGVKEEKKRNDQALGAMLRVEKTERPLFMAGRTYWEREYEENAEKIGTYLKPERFGPPELCYPTDAPTEFPAVSKMPWGKGFGISVPWYPAANYYTDGFDNWLIFMQYVLFDLCGCCTVSDTVSPMVELTHGCKADFEVFHFVNASGHYGNSFFDPAVLTDQRVTIPWRYDTAFCENLDEPGNICWELKNNKLTITIPKLGAHACVIIKEEA